VSAVWVATMSEVGADDAVEAFTAPSFAAVCLLEWLADVRLVLAPGDQRVRENLEHAVRQLELWHSSAERPFVHVTDLPTGSIRFGIKMRYLNRRA
jgi:hypothetical protein